MITMYVCPKDAIGNRTVLVAPEKPANMTGVDVVTLAVGDVYAGPKGNITIKDDTYQNYNGKEIPTYRLALSIVGGQLTKKED
jgi:hypothetical protein